ncbi:hypothetical protein [Paenarthrobacter nicotinovorans]|uniref:hypothetical protein n=1 Tax=Paenarthrobacter nicotinovorans TaxID=29320 RepID=UPI0039A6C8CD
MRRSIAESTAVIVYQMERTWRATPGLLNPGLSREQIEVEFTARGLHAGDDLLALFGWRNGTRAGQDVLLDDMWLPGYYW